MKDKGLKKALAGQSEYKLPSNFTFCTMQKVHQAVVLREKRQERRLLLAIILVSVALVAGSAFALWHFFADSLRETFQRLASIEVPALESFLPYGFISFCIFVLLGFDYWMRRHYYKRHQA